MPNPPVRRSEPLGQRVRAALILGMFALGSAGAQAPPEDLTKVSLEELAYIDVTSFSKEHQTMSQVPAAAFVIGQDKIRQAGATNIPDLLRMVPGLDVAQINANTWAISARGFNSQFANKLLVMVDGRAVYTPLLGGVSWDTVDVPLEDIDRIEVIRGPGGAAARWRHQACCRRMSSKTGRATAGPSKSA